MKRSNSAVAALTSFVSATMMGQTSIVTQPGDTRLPPSSGQTTNSKKPLPGDQGFSDLQLVEEALANSKKALREASIATAEPVEVDSSELKDEDAVPVDTTATQVEPIPPATSKTAVEESPPPPTTPRSIPPQVFLPQNGTTIFNQNLKTGWQEDMIVLPGLSSAYATILFGEEVAATETEWIAARLDYAFLGPNGAVMELNGCRVDIDIRPNFNSGKVKGMLKKLFCKSKSGRVFSQDLSGKMISAKTEYGGVESKVIMSGPARGVALEAIQTITKGVGSAMAAAQVTEQAAASTFSSLSTKNVTGDKDKYISGKALEASGDFLQYAVDFYKGLSPTQAVPPGSKVHLVVKDNVQIPKEFFTRKINLKHLERDLRG